MPDDLISITKEEVAQHITIALAVIHPPVQFGRGRKLPHEGDADRRRAGQIIAEHFERSGVHWFRKPFVMGVPAGNHWRK